MNHETLIQEYEFHRVLILVWHPITKIPNLIILFFVEKWHFSPRFSTCHASYYNLITAVYAESWRRTRRWVAEAAGFLRKFCKVFEASRPEKHMGKVVMWHCPSKSTRLACVQSTVNEVERWCFLSTRTLHWSGEIVGTAVTSRKFSVSRIGWDKFTE